MSRNHWKNVFEVIGIVSLIITMAFVAYEIRQNTNTVRSSTLHDVSRMSYDVTTLVIENPDLRAALRAYCTGDSSEDQIQLRRLFYGALMRVQQNRFYQVQLGILDESEVLAIGGRGGAYRHPYFDEFWASVHGAYPLEFVAYIEAEILPLERDTC
jgi:hypothetical protein